MVGVRGPLIERARDVREAGVFVASVPQNYGEVFLGEESLIRVYTRWGTKENRREFPVRQI